MGKIIEYDSKMNELNFGKFKEKELDLFFSICYKMKNEGLNEVTLTFQELKELSNYSRNDIKRFTKDLESTYDKMLNIKIRTETKTTITKIILFTRYHIEKEDRTVRIKIHEDGKYLLNDIEKFTKFDLMEFVSLKSSYAKNMFKMLKQFDNEDSYNWYQIKLDDFIELMGIPKHYKMGNIDQRVLSPIMEQLAPYFNGLKLEKIKRGVKVESLKFTWKAKKKQKKVENVEVVEAVKIKQGLKEEDLRKHEEREAKAKEEALKKETEAKEEKEKTHKMKITREAYAHLYIKHCEKHNIDPKNKVVNLAFDQANLKKYEFIEEQKRKIRPKKTMIIGTEIQEDLLLSGKGKKLFGMARKNKIEKILERLAKREAIRNFKYNYKFVVVEGIFSSGKSENIENLFEKLKETFTSEQIEALLKNIQK